MNNMFMKLPTCGLKRSIIGMPQVNVYDLKANPHCVSGYIAFRVSPNK